MVDSEGHVGLRKSWGEPTPIVTISNSDASLVRIIRTMLNKRGYHSSVEFREYGKGLPCYQIFLNGRYAVRLLRRLILHHPEKTAAREIIMSFARNPVRAYSSYLALRRRTKLETQSCVDKARFEYLHRDARKLRKIAAYSKLVRRARKLREKGKTICEIGISLERSQRTVYRLLQRGVIAKQKITKTQPIDNREESVSPKARL